jgi:hypothetical protein
VRAYRNDENHSGTAERNAAMQTVRNRTSWFAVLTTLLVLSCATVSHARDKQPDEVLKDQGLKRSSGATWILVGEAVFLKDVRKAQGLSVQLQGAQQQQQALELGNQNPQVLIEGYRQQVDWLGQRIDAYDQELANLGPSSGNQAANVYHNLLAQERNALVTEQNRLRRVISSLADQKGQFQDL